MIQPRRLAVFLVLVLAASCAYYNIFWMARNEYNNAVKNDGYDFWDPYALPKQPGGSKKLIESCAERCGKILLLYPKSKWVDDALLMMGNCFMLQGDNSNALRKYDELLQLYSSSQLAGMAKYMKAFTLVREGSTPQAILLLEDLLKQAKKREIKERATFLLGRIYHEGGECDKASTYFSQYLEEFREGEKAKTVRLQLASCLLKQGKAEEVIRILEPLAKGPEPEALTASLDIGRANRILGRDDAAIGIFQDIGEIAVEDTLKARAKIEIARTLLEQDSVQAAIGVLTEAADVAARFPPVKAEAFYMAGLAYEKRLQDFDRATATYEQVPSVPGFGDKAKKRAAALKEVKTHTEALTDSIGDSPEDEARHRFMMAETYLEELALPQKALVEYRVVADSFPRTKFGAPAMLATASLLEAEGDTTAARYYKAVIDSFPDQVYANVARHYLGLPLVDVVMPPADTVSVADSSMQASSIPEEAGPEFVGPPLPEFVGPPLPQPDTTGSVVPSDRGRTSKRRPPSASPGDSARVDRDHRVVPPVPAPADTAGHGEVRAPGSPPHEPWPGDTLSPPREPAPPDTSQEQAPWDTLGVDEDKEPAP